MEIETAVARNRVGDAETAVKQAQDDLRNTENVGLTTTKPETTFEEMSNAIWDCLGDLASSDDGEEGEDEDDDKEGLAGGKLREDDEPGWVMGTISKMVHYRIERFQQKQITHDELTQLGWGDVADYFLGRYKK